MDGTKPKIYSEGGEQFMKLKLQAFMDDFVTITMNTGKGAFEELKAVPIFLDSPAGKKVADFYK